MLPAGRPARDLAKHLETVRDLHAADLRVGAGWVELPWALGRQVPPRRPRVDLAWVLPRHRTYLHRETCQRARHHLHESVLQAGEEAVP